MTSTGYVTVADAARYAACSPKTIRRGIRAGDLRAVRLGRVYRTRREWIDAWLFAGIGVPDGAPGDAARIGAMATAPKTVN